MVIQLKQSIIEICILAVLFDEDITESELSRTFQREFITSEIIIYALLKKMQKEELIKCGTKKSSNDMMSRTYSITPKGKEQFEHLKLEWYELNHTAIQFIGRFIS